MKKTVVKKTQLDGPTTEPDAGFVSVDMTNEQWEGILGGFLETGAYYDLTIIRPRAPVIPSAPRTINVYTLGTPKGPKIDEMKSAIKDAGLTLPKGVTTKSAMSKFIVDNIEYFPT